MHAFRKHEGNRTHTYIISVERGIKISTVALIALGWVLRALLVAIGAGRQNQHGSSPSYTKERAGGQTRVYIHINSRQNQLGRRPSQRSFWLWTNYQPKYYNAWKLQRSQASHVCIHILLFKALHQDLSPVLPSQLIVLQIARTYSSAASAVPLFLYLKGILTQLTTWTSPRQCSKEFCSKKQLFYIQLCSYFTGKEGRLRWVRQSFKASNGERSLKKIN